ncbi:MAG: hypothetical protein WAV95_20320 [Azonexus sp.]
MSPIKTAISLLAALLFCIAPVHAEEPTAASTSAENVARVVQAQHARCIRFAEGYVGQEFFMAALANRPIKAETVCRCAEQKLAEDPRLADHWAMPEDQLLKLFDDPRLFSYVITRLTLSTQMCLATELDISLRSAELPAAKVQP